MHSAACSGAVLHTNATKCIRVISTSFLELQKLWHYLVLLIYTEQCGFDVYSLH